jgi:hypothetical protein
MLVAAATLFVFATAGCGPSCDWKVHWAKWEPAYLCPDEVAELVFKVNKCFNGIQLRNSAGIAGTVIVGESLRPTNVPGDWEGAVRPSEMWAGDISFDIHASIGDTWYRLRDYEDDDQYGQDIRFLHDLRWVEDGTWTEAYYLHSPSGDYHDAREEGGTVEYKYDLLGLPDELKEFDRTERVRIDNEYVQIPVYKYYNIATDFIFKIPSQFSARARVTNLNNLTGFTLSFSPPSSPDLIHAPVGVGDSDNWPQEHEPAGRWRGMLQEESQPRLYVGEYWGDEVPPPKPPRYENQGFHEEADEILKDMRIKLFVVCREVE